MTKITTITLTCPKPPRCVEATVAVPASDGQGFWKPLRVMGKG